MTAKPPRMVRPNWPLCGLADPGDKPFASPRGEGSAFCSAVHNTLHVFGKTLRCVCAGAQQNRPPRNKKHRGAIGPAVHLFPGSVENPGE